ncbi:MAG: protein translocase subunit SecF [Campylobacterales bacterium]|nr:protein translocase subunit SecF [Campylobacterales bacterium]
MQIFSYDKVFNLMAKKFIFLGLSVVVVATAFTFIFGKGPSFGIDFVGGTVVQVQYQEKAPLTKIREVLKNSQYSDAFLQEFGSDKEIVIKLPTVSNAIGSDIGDSIRGVLKATGDFEIRRVDMVGPKVGNELREKGISALAFAIIGVLIYIAFRFEWRFAVASVIALIHDIVITTGFVVAFDVTVNLEILAALLTILGYSLNDTIVVFDRIREGLTTSKSNKLDTIINESVSRTLSRTTLTSLTTFFVVLVLFLFGGELINGLSFTLLIGVVVGTYSSIFIAASTLSLLGFSPSDYRNKQAEKERIKREKERIRAQYEGGAL